MKDQFLASQHKIVQKLSCKPWFFYRTFTLLNEKQMKIILGHNKYKTMFYLTTLLISGRTTSNWRQINYRSIIITVEMNDCGFINIPTVTNSIEGTAEHEQITGTSSIYHLEKSSFSVVLYFRGLDLPKGDATKYQWNVEWIAVGSVC